MSMTIIPILAVGIIMKLVAVVFVICSIVLILVVLIQKGRGGGLSGAFAGGAASGLLGSKTGDFLTWVTIIVVSIFLGLAIIMAKFYRPSIIYSSGQDVTTRQPTDQKAPSTQGAATTTTEASGSGAEANSTGG
jgi:preprotein translocase subunit SecG